MEATIEELEAKIAELTADVEAKDSQIAELTADVEALKKSKGPEGSEYVAVYKDAEALSVHRTAVDAHLKIGWRLSK